MNMTDGEATQSEYVYQRGHKMNKSDRDATESEKVRKKAIQSE